MSTLFPVLTSFRSNLPLQRIWDHGLRRGLPSKKSLVNVTKAPSHGGSPRDYTHNRFGHRQAIHTLSNGTGGPHKRKPPNINEPHQHKVGGWPKPLPSQASTPRRTGTSMARTRMGQPTLSPRTSALEVYRCQGTFLPREPTPDFTSHGTLVTSTLEGYRCRGTFLPQGPTAHHTPRNGWVLPRPVNSPSLSRQRPLAYSTGSPKGPIFWHPAPIAS